MQEKEYRYSGCVRYDFSTCFAENGIQVALKTYDEQFQTLYKCLWKEDSLPQGLSAAFPKLASIYKLFSKKSNFELDPIRGVVSFIVRSIKENELVEEKVGIELTKIKEVKNEDVDYILVELKEKKQECEELARKNKELSLKIASLFVQKNLQMSQTHEVKKQFSTFEEFKQTFKAWKIRLEAFKARIKSYPTITEDNGKYTGQMSGKLKQGMGVFHWKQGDDWYQGEFYGDCAHGMGIYHFPNGDIYEGEYNQYFIQGKGTYYQKNGRRYEGQWKKGMKHGSGIMYEADGTSKNVIYQNGEEVVDIDE